MAKRVLKKHHGGYVRIRGCRIDLSANMTKQELNAIDKNRPELLEDEPKPRKAKPSTDSK